ncbi:MAG TPA: hypothetical protein DEA32_03330 [Firmicutes bacterium]|nr:hypothetical protein [Bacillota bacterium]
MRIRRLGLKDYRNFEEADIAFKPGLNFICGPNGAGKTNLLEAIAYLGQVHSFRKSLDRDLIRVGQKMAMIHGEFDSNLDSYTKIVDVTISPQSKLVKLDGKRMKTISAFYGSIAVTCFDPRRVFLFRSEPGERRKAIDEALSSIYPKYLYTLSRYRMLLKLRNQALQQRCDDDVVGAYTRELISNSYRLVCNRKELLTKADALAGPTFSDLFGGGARIAISYRTDMPDIDDYETFRAQAEDNFERKRSIERTRRMTALGPHLDDVICTIDGKPISSFGSQGQNRLASLSFILALAKIIGDSKKDYPILVMDDVLSDLDEKRRGNLLSLAEKLGQTIISGNEADHSGNRTIISVDNGRVVPAEEVNNG